MTSDNTSLVIVFALILLLSLYYLFGSNPTHNEGSLPPLNERRKKRRTKCKPNMENDVVIVDDETNDSDVSNGNNSTYTDGSSSSDGSNSNDNDSVDSSIEIIRERSMGMNGPFFRKKNGGKYKHDSYRALGSGDTLTQIDKQFKVTDVTKNYNDRFVPMNESGDDHAPVNFKNNKGTEKDKYNIDSYLPQEKEKDWFETIDTVNVKNSHLINLYRPIGANTIGSSHKEAIYDIRGLDNAVCPKFVVSPWLQSSTEPDESLKSLCSN
jgi:hypothetical protein